MVRIRFQRVGRPHDPHYRLVAIHKTKARDASALEVLGHYHPKNTSDKLSIQPERLRYWFSQGAQPSESVISLLKASGLWAQFQSAS